MVKPIEESFADWESHVFGFGYGTGEQHVLPALKKFFSSIGSDNGGYTYDYVKLEEAVGATVAWLFINILCRYDVSLIEYGTSPRFGWLTKEGRNMQSFLASKSDDELLNIENSENNCTPHVCNCGPDGHQVGVHCENPFWKNRKMTNGN